jgi:hypothetical protein
MVGALNTGAENTTLYKQEAIYYPVRYEDTRKMEVVNGNIAQTDVGSYFNLIEINGEQKINYATKSETS